jgi:hypothetical protein
MTDHYSEKLLRAINDQTAVLTVIAKELALLAESHGTSVGRQIAGVLIDDLDKFLRHEEEQSQK